MPETTEQRHIRETRDATYFVAVVLAVVVMAAILGGVVVVVRHMADHSANQQTTQLCRQEGVSAADCP